MNTRGGIDGNGNQWRPPLTRAEEKILGLVAESLTNKEIAASLGISPSTVKRHLENILQKLRLRNRVEAAIYALSLKGCPEAAKGGECPLAKVSGANGRNNNESYGPFGR